MFNILKTYLKMGFKRIIFHMSFTTLHIYDWNIIESKTSVR